MNANPSIKICILLLGILLFGGCRQPDDAVAVVPSPDNATAAAYEDLPSDVKLTLPDADSGSTLVLRAEGKFDPAVHDFTKPFEFEFKGRTHYRVRITCKPFMKDDWAINPLADITNETDSTLYVAYYAAFFNQEGHVVGVCHQTLDVEPSERPMQLASLVIDGPKERLLTATHFKIVVYESTQPIGTLPISPERAATMVGRSSKVVAKLDEVQPVVTAEGADSVVRFQTKVAFVDQVGKDRNTYLKFESVEPYQFSIDVRKRDLSKSNGEGNVHKQYSGWELDSDFERIKRTKTVWPKGHVVLLDAQGQLIACDSDMFTFVAVPEDAILSATQINFVLYEKKIERK
ncbi:hypothetical protein [Aureliella helgolandensis]|uniref:Uncharacterized protein n=1 Tax=Aureliella helgolandensis TaxID=2527968 RepID=A0A518G3K2_9BACT|nr:hypothetical protein [Aureliella helgolandensis]QDV23168.1 hypothetical protein Q31a_14650 [Aureliella helgolandensis]